MQQKPKVRFLTAVWGARYVREFAEVSLPSFLAPGNLPLLAAHASLEVVVLTTQASVAAFEAEPAFRRLRSVCSVRFLYIDDLVTTTNYGVTLTLAYARGVMDAGEGQTETWFVFMNSDFVIADGGMRTLVRCFEEGCRCIMSASLRARADEALPILRAAVTEDGTVLSIRPRDAVDLALTYPHATVIGKTVTQSAVTCLTLNQAYWVADATTLLSRNHLIFMLAIRPERPMTQISSYCDYGFVPELVPSGEHRVISDSDDFFMLELQPASQERELLRGGKTEQERAARHLSQWTTSQHREFARHDVVFHSADLPADLPRLRDAAQAFVTSLHARMGRPVDHIDHIYWALGVEAWKRNRAQQLGLSSLTEEMLPPELREQGGRSPFWGTGRIDQRLRTALRRVRSLLSRSLVRLVGEVKRASGRFPEVALWHHRWPDAEVLNSWVAEVLATDHDRRIIAWADQPGAAPALARRTDADLVLLGDDGCSEPHPLAREERCREVLIYATPKRLRSIRTLIDKIDPQLEINGRVSVFVDAEMGSTDLATEFAQSSDEFLCSSWMRYEVRISFVGSRGRRFLCRLQYALMRYLTPSSATSAPLFVLAFVAWPIVAALTAVSNLVARRPSSSAEPNVTSAMLELRKLACARPTRFASAAAQSVDSAPAA